MAFLRHQIQLGVCELVALHAQLQLYRNWRDPRQELAFRSLPCCSLRVAVASLVQFGVSNGNWRSWCICTVRCPSKLFWIMKLNMVGQERTMLQDYGTCGVAGINQPTYMHMKVHVTVVSSQLCKAIVIVPCLLFFPFTLKIRYSVASKHSQMWTNVEDTSFAPSTRTIAALNINLGTLQDVFAETRRLRERWVK